MSGPGKREKGGCIIVNISDYVTGAGANGATSVQQLRTCKYLRFDSAGDAEQNKSGEEERVCFSIVIAAAAVLKISADPDALIKADYNKRAV